MPSWAISWPKGIISFAPSSHSSGLTTFRLLNRRWSSLVKWFTFSSAFSGAINKASIWTNNIQLLWDTTDDAFGCLRIIVQAKMQNRNSNRSAGVVTTVFLTPSVVSVISYRKRSHAAKWHCCVMYLACLINIERDSGLECTTVATGSSAHTNVL